MMSLRIAALAAVLLSSHAAAATLEDWRADLATIDKDIRTIHPNPFTKTPEPAYRAAYDKLAADLPSLSEEQRMVRAMQLVALVGDGHTQLSPDRPDFAYWYPLRLYQFSDGYFITAARKSDPDLVGAQVLAVAGKPVGQVIDDVRTAMGADNALTRRENIFAFNSAQLMKGFGYAAADGSLKVRLKLRSGKTVERILMPEKAGDPRYSEDDSQLDWIYASEVYGPPVGALGDWVTAYKGLPTTAFRAIDNTRPPHFTFRRAFVARAIPEHDAYYIQANGVASWGGKEFDALFRDALKDVDTLKPKSLIVDIRYNPGGDGSRVPPMIHEFIKREDNPPWKHLYLITGRKTFSAAVMMIAAFVDHTKVSIIGEPAGGALDHFGDATTISLPRTGMILNVATLWHQLEDVGARYAIMPVDVPATLSFADWQAGRDPAVDPILKGEEMRSIPLIAVEDGGKAARAVFEARKKKYAAYADWMKLRQFDLTKAFWRLNDAKPADALEVARIMVELYPDSARAYGYLGDALIATGDRAAGFAAYKKALALDPNTLANMEERAAMRDAKFHKPSIVRFGVGVAALEPALKNICKSVATRRVDPPFLDRVKDKQMQIDCEGFDFEGKPRHAEFVFGDDALKFVWIMTTPDERASLEARMTEAYGPPAHTNERYLGYAQGRAALRLDRAEVLFYGQDAEADVLAEISK